MPGKKNRTFVQIDKTLTKIFFMYTGWTCINSSKCQWWSILLGCSITERNKEKGTSFNQHSIKWATIREQLIYSGKFIYIFIFWSYRWRPEESQVTSYISTRYLFLVGVSSGYFFSFLNKFRVRTIIYCYIRFLVLSMNFYSFPSIQPLLQYLWTLKRPFLFVFGHVRLRFK